MDVLDVGNGKYRVAARTNDLDQIGQHVPGIVEMLQHVKGDQQVEIVRRQSQLSDRGCLDICYKNMVQFLPSQRRCLWVAFNAEVVIRIQGLLEHGPSIASGTA